MKNDFIILFIICTLFMALAVASVDTKIAFPMGVFILFIFSAGYALALAACLTIGKKILSLFEKNKEP